MPIFVSDELGALDDSVRLRLAGEEVVIAESWEVRDSVLSQPANWQVRLGWGDVAAALISKYPPRTPFQLYVGGALQFSGRTDARAARQGEGAATEIEIRGRDALAPIHDTYVRAVVGVNVSTYADLVWYALQQVGLAPKAQKTIDPTILRTDNNANRSIKAGVAITAILPHRTVEQILEDAGLGGPNVGVVHTTPQAKLNETWHHFIRRHIDRAGLMLWAGADGSFVLAAPNPNQQPTYNLVRHTGDPTLGANVVAMDFEDDATHRHSEALVYGRGGGKVLGRVKAKGGFLDAEMTELGYQQPIVYRDANVHSVAEAAYFARRKLAEERRGGWRLEYTVSGHTLPYAQGAATDRAVIVPDTIVSVDDQELGLSGHYYIETVVRRRSPQTTTTLRLMRPEDLVFGADDEEAA